MTAVHRRLLRQLILALLLKLLLLGALWAGFVRGAARPVNSSQTAAHLLGPVPDPAPHSEGTRP